LAATSPSKPSSKCAWRGASGARNVTSTSCSSIPLSRKTLGLERKYQNVRGTAEEKIPATIKDIEAWPIPGLVVFAGEGFTENMRQFLISTGKAVEFEELRPWLCLFFGLPLG